MKKFTVLAAGVAALTLGLLSCNKIQHDSAARFDDSQIVLRVDDSQLNITAGTKATALDAIPASLYWGASTGSVGSDVVKYAASSSSVVNGEIATGQYQTATPTSYNWYVSNHTFTIPESAGAVTMAVADNSIDVVAGRATSSGTDPEVTLNHIFARTGSVGVTTAAEGYTISNESWTIVSTEGISGTAGTYNLSTGAWTAIATSLASQSLTSSSDLYLVPGQYVVSVSFTITKGDYSNTYSQTATVSFAGGYINNIAGKLTDGNGGPFDPAQGSAITIGVTLTPWQTQTLTPDFS